VNSIKCAGMLAVLSLLSSGCCGLVGGRMSSPTGSAPGGLIADGTYGSGGTCSFIRFEGSDVEVLGQVQSSTESETTLGLISRGDNGYGKVVAAARAKYPTCNGVINLQWDTQYNTICSGILYEKVTTIIEGTAVRYKNSNEKK
jgi:hypothetical protein